MRERPPFTNVCRMGFGWTHGVGQSSGARRYSASFSARGRSVFWLPIDRPAGGSAGFPGGSSTAHRTSRRCTRAGGPNRLLAVKVRKRPARGSSSRRPENRGKRGRECVGIRRFGLLWWSSPCSSLHRRWRKRAESPRRRRSGRPHPPPQLRRHRWGRQPPSLRARSLWPLRRLQGPRPRHLDRPRLAEWTAPPTPCG